MREGLPLPRRMQEAPELEQGLEFYYHAFWALNSDRPLGFGEGLIPRTAVYDYSRHWGLDMEEIEDLMHHIREMDKVYLRSRNKKGEGK